MSDSKSDIVKNIVKGCVIIACLFLITQCITVPMRENHEIRKLQLEKEMLLIEHGIPLDKPAESLE